MVAQEVGGVDLDPVDQAGRGEPHHEPVVPAVASSSGLPPVAHVAGVADLQHLLGGEKNSPLAASATPPLRTDARSTAS